MALQTLHRTLSADFLNEVANHPEVRPFVGGSGVVDVAPVVTSPHNVALVGKDGGFVFVRDEATRFELHTLLLPHAHGAGVLPAFAEAARFMFTATDCLEITTKIPASNKAAALMARRAGFEPISTRPAAWPDGSDVTFFILTLDVWRAGDTGLVSEGEAFHQMLEMAKRESGSELGTHADDPTHDQAVGAAALMFKAGNPGKAVMIYNRWARLTGYATIELAAIAPPLIDVRDAIVGLSGNRLEVVLCR